MVFRVRLVAAVMALWLTLCFAASAGVPKDSPIPTPSGRIGSGASAEGSFDLSNLRRVSLSAKGKRYDLSVCKVSDTDYAVSAYDKTLSAVAGAFGAKLSWHDRHGLTVKRGGKHYNMAVGQRQLPSELGGRELDFPCQIINGTPWVSLLGVGDMLGLRFTVDSKASSAWAEGLINDVHLEGAGDNQQLVVQAEHEVSYKTFSLKNPSRFVVDISGGVLNVASPSIAHAKLGTIRLGQFTLGPAVTRIVIPLASGYQILPPGEIRGRVLRFAIKPSSGAGVSGSGSSGSPRTPAKPAVAYSFRTQQLTRSSADERKGVCVVHLEFSGPVQYEWSRLIAPDYRFFVDLPNVILPDSKKELKVRHRHLSGVRISQNSGRPNPKARVVLDMSRPLEVKVSPGSNGKSLDIEIGSNTVEANTSIISGNGITGSGSAQPASGSGDEPVSVYRPKPGSGVRTICIDPGHGGNDSGAYNRSLDVAEEDVTLDVGLRLRDLLRSSGWNVVMTRETDRDVSYAGSTDSEELWARAKVANDCGADVFVSIHCNSAANSAAEGTSIHAYKQGDIVLGEEMIAPLIRATGRRNRGVHQDRFYVLAHTQMPAVLVETAFVSHSEEGRLLGDPVFRQRIAEGLAEGLNNYAYKYLKDRGTAKPSTLSTPAPKRSYITVRPAAVPTSKSDRDSDAVLPQSVLK